MDDIDIISLVSLPDISVEMKKKSACLVWVDLGQWLSVQQKNASESIELELVDILEAIFKL